MKVRLGPCKGKDFASTLGPWIVTADEFAHRHDDDGFLDVAMTAWISGAPLGTDRRRTWGGRSPTWSPTPRRTPWCSPATSGLRYLRARLPGQAVGPHGALDPPPLAEGDRVRLEVEGIGAVENTVGARRREGVPAAPARRRGRARAAGEPAAARR